MVPGVLDPSNVHTLILRVPLILPAAASPLAPGASGGARGGTGHCPKEIREEGGESNVDERREEDETESTRANEKECSPIIVVVVAFLSSFVESRCYHTNTKGGGVFLFQLSLVFLQNDFLLP